MNGVGVGLSDITALKETLKRTPDQKLMLTIGDEKVEGVVGSAGVSADEQATMKRLAEYPWYWRIVPFSSIVIGSMRDEPIQTKVDKKVTEEYAKKVTSICSTPTHNAMLKVNGESVELDPAKSGTSCPTESIVAQLDKQTVGKSGLQHTFQLTEVKPKRSDSDVKALLSQAQAVVAQPLTVTVAGKTYAVPKATVAAWLMLSLIHI